MKANTRATTRLVTASAAAAQARRLLNEAESELKNATLDAAGLTPGQTMIEWETPAGRVVRGVVVDIDGPNNWLVARRVLPSGGLHSEPTTVLCDGRVLDETWEGETP